MTIELIRHGETALQAEHRYQGCTDAPLSEKGLAALCPADFVPDLLCVTSLLRTRQTAAAVFPGVPQTVFPGLEEMNFGAFEGRNYIEMQNDVQYRHWVDGMCEGRCPDGESKAEFCRRVNTAFAELLRSAAGRKIDTLALVAHGGTIMAIMEQLCVQKRSYYDWHTDSGKGYLLDCRNPGTEPVLQFLGETDHTRR